MARNLENLRCGECRQKSMRRVRRPYEYEVSHDGRPPVKIRIPDLEVVACTNPECRPENPGDTVILDDAATTRVTMETYRQLGLLTPEEIRTKREQLGLTQQQLAELLGLGGNSLSRWEKGRVYQSRSLDKLLRVIFDVPEALRFLKTERVAEGNGENLRAKFPYLFPANASEPIRQSKNGSFTPKSYLVPDEVVV